VDVEQSPLELSVALSMLPNRLLDLRS